MSQSDQPNQSDPGFLSVEAAAQLLRRRKISPVELLDHVLARARKLNPHLNAFLTIAEESARAEAKRAQDEIMRGKYRGPLHGIPVAVKDNIITRGIRTTAGSKFFSPSEDALEATVVRRLRRSGAVLLGKTNLHEFAYGVTTNNPHFGPTRNPWNLERIPGGSSGGSAAVLAAGMACAALGTDTGGSIRIPAALCGIVGLKPTYGRVSCAGVVPLSRTLDHTGPMTRTVRDAAIMLSAIAGYDPLDPGSVRHSVSDYQTELHKRIKGTIIGVPRNYFFERVDSEVRKVVQRALDDLERLGALIEEIQLPDFAQTVDPSTLIAFAEATQFHQQAGFFPAHESEYGADVQERLGKGLDVKATGYITALDLRSTIAKEMDAVFENVAVIVAPATSIPAPRIGEEEITIEGSTETVRSALIRLNRPANFTGHPAVSIPCGFTKSGLPVGLQLIGRKWGEADLLQVAYAYEQATTWHNLFPRQP